MCDERDKAEWAAENGMTSLKDMHALTAMPTCEPRNAQRYGVSGRS